MVLATQVVHTHTHTHTCFRKQASAESPLSPREASTKPDRGNGSERGGCRERFPRDSIQTKVVKNLLHGTSYLGILCKEFVVNQAEKEHVEGKNTKDCSPRNKTKNISFLETVPRILGSSCQLSG